MESRNTLSQKVIKAMSVAALMAIIPLFGFRGLPTDSLEQIKYHHFLLALENMSTFNYFTVVTVKDLRFNKVKEICTKGNFLSGAIHRELGMGYDPIGESNVLKWAMSKKDRYFEFKNPKALDNISFSDYDPKSVKAIQKKYNFDAIVSQIKATKYSLRILTVSREL